MTDVQTSDSLIAAEDVRLTPNDQFDGWGEEARAILWIPLPSWCQTALCSRRGRDIAGAAAIRFPRGGGAGAALLVAAGIVNNTIGHPHEN